MIPAGGNHLLTGQVVVKSIASLGGGYIEMVSWDVH